VTERANPIRWYVDGAELVGRKSGQPDERCQVKDLPAYLLVEGYVALRSKGRTHAEIMTGAADRALPNGGTSKLTQDAKWREAIAYAVAEEETRASFVGISKEAKDAAIAEGRAYAAGISKADVRDHQTRLSVIQWYAKLHGEKGPIRQRLAEAAE